MSTTQEIDARFPEHREAVQRIVDQVGTFHKQKLPFRISHGSTNSTRDQRGKGRHFVKTGDLSRVLLVDAATRTVLVEPNVPMDRLVEATLPHGLIPPVVMEFPGITVGGGYSGTSGESSSFKYGFFDKTIRSVEMVLADGKRVLCSKQAYPDLFHGAAGAMGSLGVTTLVELELKPAKRYVHVTYHPVASMQEASLQIRQHVEDASLDYVDGIMFSPYSGVVILGRETNGQSQESLPVQRFSGSADPWFYLHASDLATRRPKITNELVPLAEYLFRYDRGGFWVGTAAFKYFGMPFHRKMRQWLDDFLHTRMLYSALHASGQHGKLIIQDLALPFETAAEFVEYSDKATGIYPLWLCPLKQSTHPTMHPHLADPTAPMLNIGLWGWGPRDASDCRRLNAELERRLRGLGGMKWLYAQAFYTQEQFWSMFDRRWYETLRQKYNATSLPNIYDKLAASRESHSGNALLNVRPFGGLYGILKAIQSKTYLAARASKWKHL